MRVSFVQGDEISDHAPGELEDLLQREDGFVWVDVPELDPESEAVLTSCFDCHGRVVESCGMRNHLPTVHGYQDHVFVVLHARWREPPVTSISSSSIRSSGGAT